MPDSMSRRSFLALAGSAFGTALAFPMGAQARPLRTHSAATPGPAPSEPVIRIDVAGGFVPAEVAYSTIPKFVLYATGSVIFEGPVPLIYPPPVLPNLRQTMLTEAGVQMVVSAAREAGLLDGNRRYENHLVADAPTTVFTVWADGHVTRVMVYALAYGNDPSWSPAEREAVERIRHFYEQAMDLVSWLPAEVIVRADEPYPIERLQVIAEPIDPAAPTPDPHDPIANQPAKDWPLPVSLGNLERLSLPGLPDSARCAVFSDEEAQILVSAFRQANLRTPWISDGTTYHLYVRPLLPGESGCPPPDPFAEPGLATPAG
ncbi:MAG: hypothetical protein KatS3mg059_1396 [Thermomicrobiales bacterium]|nr:MAG: hypothetical protein KatS3mg059_1396 [Thermomicrobiales bacterium]